MSYTFSPQNITIEALKYNTLIQEEYLEELGPSMEIWSYEIKRSIVEIWIIL